MGYTVIEDSLFYGINLLHSIKPSVLFITNSTGAPENIYIVKYAKKLGIKVISFVSEGVFRPEGVKGMTWGWNTEEKIYEDVHLQWSERSKNIMVKAYPEFTEITKVSGGIGFDQYKLLKEKSTDFKEIYGKQKYTKTVGYGCHDFGTCLVGDTRYKDSNPLIEERRSLRDEVNTTLVEMVAANEDILFVFKQHPGAQLGRYASAIEGVEKYTNTIVLKNEFPIKECILQSDFWLSFWSTTIMEAWLLGKSTLAYLPKAAMGFPSATSTPTMKGTPIVNSLKDLNHSIRSFYDCGDIPGFQEKADQREVIYKEIIQWTDGLNHVRAGNAIIELVNESYPKTKLKFGSGLTILRLMEFLNWHFSKHLTLIPRFNRFYSHKRILWDPRELKILTKRYHTAQLNFYRHMGYSIQRLAKIKVI
jgi:surface carbohydrate biosynthesis protein